MLKLLSFVLLLWCLNLAAQKTDKKLTTQIETLLKD